MLDAILTVVRDVLAWAWIFALVVGFAWALRFVARESLEALAEVRERKALDDS